jgi:hypothetical protein
VTNKGEIKKTGSGSTILTFHGLDKTGEISITAFRSEVEKFASLIQVKYYF